MAQFTTLQKRVFPVYLQIQTGLVVLSALTYPPAGLASLLTAPKWVRGVALAIKFGISLLNWRVYGPRTQDAMIERIHQGGYCPTLVIYAPHYPKQGQFSDENPD